MVKVYIYEYATSKLIDTLIVDFTPSYDVGQFFINERDVENYKENMYIIRAVTHLRPDLTTGAGQVAIHIEKYNPEEVTKTFEKLLKKLEKLGE